MNAQAIIPMQHGIFILALVRDWSLTIYSTRNTNQNLEFY
jgi:hypothetical protein